MSGSRKAEERSTNVTGQFPTGDVDPMATDKGKNPAAVSLGRMGGKARAAGLSAKRRKEIAKKAARARWQ